MDVFFSLPSPSLSFSSWIELGIVLPALAACPAPKSIHYLTEPSKEQEVYTDNIIISRSKCFILVGQKHSGTGGGKKRSCPQEAEWPFEMNWVLKGAELDLAGWTGMRKGMGCAGVEMDLYVYVGGRGYCNERRVGPFIPHSSGSVLAFPRLSCRSWA